MKKEDEICLIVKGSIKESVSKKYGPAIKTKSKTEGAYFCNYSPCTTKDIARHKDIEKKFQAREDTEILKILKSDFKKAVLNSINQEEAKENADFLRKIPIFQTIPEDDLNILSGLVTEHKYFYGNLLTKASEEPPGMIIIREGQCQVCLDKNAARIEGVRSPYDDSKKELFTNLGETAFFGSRMLISAKEWEEIYHEKTRCSYLSVVGITSLVKVLILHRAMFTYISDRAKFHLLERARQFIDPDRPQNTDKLDERREGIEEWEKYKEKVTNEACKVIERAKQLKSFFKING